MGKSTSQSLTVSLTYPLHSHLLCANSFSIYSKRQHLASCTRVTIIGNTSPCATLRVLRLLLLLLLLLLEVWRGSRHQTHEMPGNKRKHSHRCGLHVTTSPPGMDHSNSSSFQLECWAHRSTATRSVISERQHHVAYLPRVLHSRFQKRVFATCTVSFLIRRPLVVSLPQQHCRHASGHNILDLRIKNSSEEYEFFCRSRIRLRIKRAGSTRVCTLVATHLQARTTGCRHRSGMTNAPPHHHIISTLIIT